MSNIERVQIYTDRRMSDFISDRAKILGICKSAFIYRVILEYVENHKITYEDMKIIKKNNERYEAEQKRITDMGRIYTVINSHKKITDFIIKNNRVSRKKVNVFMIQKIIKGEVERIAKTMQKDEIESYEEIIDKWVFCITSDEDCENYIFEVTKDYIDNQNNDKGFFKHRK